MAESTFYVVNKDDCLTEGMSKEQILTAIEQSLEQGYVSNPDGAVFSKIKEMRANGTAQIWIGTEAQFNAISPAPTIGKSVVRIGENSVMYICSDDSTLNDLFNHLSDENNPHGVTFRQVAGADVLPTSKGGTGNTNGRAVSAASADTAASADKATKLATARSIQTNLGSTSAASFDGSGNVTPGVTGVLPLSNGGLGATTGAGACANIGAVKKSGDTMTGDLFVDKYIYGNSFATRLTGDNTRFALMYSGIGAAILQSNAADWSGKNRLVLYDDHTSLDKPLDISSGGTGATNAADALANLGAFRYFGKNVISSTDDDTTSRWNQLGCGYSFYEQSGLLKDQPSTWGILVSFAHSAETFQLWRDQAGGATYWRNGNSSGWNGTWRKVYDTANKPTPSDIGAVAKSGDEMTGTLKTPYVQIWGSDDGWDGVDIQRSSDGAYRCGISAIGNANMLTFRAKNPNGAVEFYKLPIPTATEDKWYNILTDKTVVYSSSQPAVIDGGIWLKPI